MWVLVLEQTHKCMNNLPLPRAGYNEHNMFSTQTGFPGYGVPRTGFPVRGSPVTGSPDTVFPAYGVPRVRVPPYGVPRTGFPVRGSPDTWFPGHGFPVRGFPGPGFPGYGVPHARRSPAILATLGPIWMTLSPFCRPQGPMWDPNGRILTKGRPIGGLWGPKRGELWISRCHRQTDG